MAIALTMACDRLEGVSVLTRLLRGSCYTNSAYRFQTVASYRLVSKCTWNSNNLGESAAYPFKRSFSPPCNSLYLLETPQYRICNCCVGKLGRQCASKDWKITLEAYASKWRLRGEQRLLCQSLRLSLSIEVLATHLQRPPMLLQLPFSSIFISR